MNLLKRYRSARTGQYVNHAEAQANQDTTVSETSNLYFKNPAFKDAAVLEVETDGTSHGTVLTLNGKSLSGCSAITLTIDVESQLAKATLELDGVAVHYTGRLHDEP